MGAAGEPNLRSNRPVDGGSTPPSLRIESVQSRAPLELSDLRFSSAGPREFAVGLLGWLSFVLNGVLRVDGVAVRRTMDGRMSLSFPERVAQDGRRHPIVRPIDGHARAALEAAVIDALEVELRKIS